METYEIDVPYNKSTNPPYSLDVKRMIKRVKKKITKWLDKIEPEFVLEDALKLIKYDSGLKSQNIYLLSAGLFVAFRRGQLSFKITLLLFHRNQ